MNPLKKAASLAAVFVLLFAGQAFAQVSKDGMGKVVPVELYLCTYNEGKGPADLDKVIARWNKFMDDNGTDDYSAWTLTPYHYGPEQDFDVIWLGAFADGNAMGTGINTWLTKGGDIQKGYNEVLDCSAHLGMSSAMYKAPVDGNAPASGIITMMDCELNEGHRYEEVKAAEIKWAEHLAGNGSKAAYYHWFPVFGGGDAEFDYKVVFAYPSYVELGADFEMYANGGGREASQEIFDDVDECNDARVYVANNRRSGKIR